jgi:hypothetical protein
MLQVLREMDSLLTMGRSRVTRSAQSFSRPFGSPFFIAAPAHNRTNQIPIKWAEEAVAFSVAPVIRDGRQSRGLESVAGGE